LSVDRSTVLVKAHGPLEEAILNAPSYADDHHPATGHMHAVMHSDPTVRVWLMNDMIEPKRTCKGCLSM
jgi:hypothetical protein